MADLLRFPVRGTRDVLAGYRVDRGRAAVAILEDMVFPDQPADPLYIGAAGAGVIYLGAAAIATRYLGPRRLF